MNKETVIKKVVELFYDGGSIIRNGCYDLNKETAIEAAIEYLGSGKNVLKEFDQMTWLSWGKGPLEDDEIVFLDRTLKKKSYWNIFHFYNKEEIETFKERLKQAIEQNELKNSYHNRRKNQFNQSLKNEIKNRDKKECVTCHSKENLVIHHIKKVIDGGTNKSENLITLCIICHKKIHAKSKK